jgi:chromosome segregation ATPase
MSEEVTMFDPHHNGNGGSATVESAQAALAEARSRYRDAADRADAEEMTTARREIRRLRGIIARETEDADLVRMSHERAEQIAETQAGLRAARAHLAAALDRLPELEAAFAEATATLNGLQAYIHATQTAHTDATIRVRSARGQASAARETVEQLANRLHRLTTEEE